MEIVMLGSGRLKQSSGAGSVCYRCLSKSIGCIPWLQILASNVAERGPVVFVCHGNFCIGAPEILLLGDDVSKVISISTMHFDSG